MSIMLTMIAVIVVIVVDADYAIDHSYPAPIPTAAMS